MLEVRAISERAGELYLCSLSQTAISNWTSSTIGLSETASATGVSEANWSKETFSHCASVPCRDLNDCYKHQIWEANFTQRTGEILQTFVELNVATSFGTFWRVERESFAHISP